VNAPAPCSSICRATRSPGLGAHARQRLEAQQARFRDQQTIKHGEASHQPRRVAEIGGAARRHVEHLGIAAAKIVQRFGDAGVRTEIVEFPGDAFPRALGDTRQPAHSLLPSLSIYGGAGLSHGKNPQNARRYSEEAAGRRP